MEKTELKQLMMTTVCPYLKSELVVILRVIFQALYFSVGIHLIWKYNVLWTDTQPYQPTKHFAEMYLSEYFIPGKIPDYFWTYSKYFLKSDVETSLTFSQRQKSLACFKDAVVCWQLVVSILFFTKILKSTRKQTRSSKFLSFESRHVDDVCSCE